MRCYSADVGAKLIHYLETYSGQLQHQQRHKVRKGHKMPCSVKQNVFAVGKINHIANKYHLSSIIIWTNCSCL